MMAAVAQGVLNFILVGDDRCGAGVVLTTLNNRPDVVCHAGLFAPSEDDRRLAHETYFGPSDPEASDPDHFVENVTNPWDYINRTVLDNPHRGESAVGLHLTYATLRRWELCDLLTHRYRDGDFCLVHVVRNPVACLVSLKQAERTGSWQRLPGEPGRHPPSAVTLDPAELTEFCRAHAATRTRVRAACGDALEVAYRDLFVDYQAVMGRVCEFLELPDAGRFRPGSRRLRNRRMADRVSNLAALAKAVPSDVRDYLREDLF
jgi:hypothetical protein